jgi:twitching motility two-component system response regulator PilG
MLVVPSQSQTSLKDAVAAAKAGDKDQARRLLAEVTREEPDNELAWLWFASVAESPAQAVARLDRVLGLNAGNERARGALRAALLQAGMAAAKASDKAGARGFLRRLTEQEPDDEQGWLWLAGVAESAEQAIQALQQVLRINPKNGRALSGIDWYRKQAAVPDAAGPGGEKARPIAVMVVDDSPTVRKLVSITMERQGHRVITAADGYEAADRLREQGIPDLILLDIAMPGLDGYTVCRFFRQNAATANLPIIMLSGKDGFFSKVRGRVAGSTEYVTKPFKPEALLALVEKYCRPKVSSPALGRP